MASNITTLVVYLRNIGGLIFTPYATMRKISLEGSWGEVVYFFILSFLYFLITNTIRFWFIGFLGATGLFIVSILFFSFFPGQGSYRERIKRLIFTWSYTLVPTFIWFYSTLFFYFILPPPRTQSIFGQAFSVFYIAYSVSLLIWKIILVYLSLRFSLRIHLYRVIYYILLYVTLSIPLWVTMYRLGISRIPFV
jgi:hypothetical protein